MAEGKMNPRGDTIFDESTPGHYVKKSDDGTRMEDGSLLDTEEEVDSSKTLRVPAGTIRIGNQLFLKDATGGLYYTRLFDDRRFSPVIYGWDDTGTFLRPFTVDFEPRIIRDIIQPDDSGDFLGTSITIERTATDDRFIFKVYNKFGSITPPDDLKFKLYINSITEDNLIVDQVVKDVCGSGTFIANTEFCFDLSPLVRVMYGQDFFLIWESASNFSLKTNAAGTIPWEAIDRQDGDAYRLLDERDIDDKYLGLYTSLAALELAHPTAVPGQYGYVDQGVGQDIVVYIWDDDDSKYVLQLGESTAETPASIKSKYESNPNTNEFSDTEKTKLSNQSGINTGDQDLSGLVPEAPNDGKQYSRKSEDWSETTDTVTGWISGLGITEDSPKGTPVNYDSGTYKIEGIGKTITPAGVYDLASHFTDMVDDQHALVSICVDNDEVIKSIRGEVAEKGEVASTPIQPYNSICLAIVEIKVDGSDNPKDIDNKHITDERNKTSINTDETVSISADDESTGYLADKITLTGNITGTIVPDGNGKEVLNLDVPAGSGVLPSILYTGIIHIDGMDISTLYPKGILWVDSIADINLQSLQNGQDKQIIHVINLSLKKVRFENNNGTYDSIIVEGNADLIADKYGGGTIIYNASKGNWYLAAIS